MLRREHDGINAYRRAKCVLDSNLALCVGPEPGDFATFARGRQAAHEPVRE